MRGIWSQYTPSLAKPHRPLYAMDLHARAGSCPLGYAILSESDLDTDRGCLIFPLLPMTLSRCGKIKMGGLILALRSGQERLFRASTSGHQHCPACPTTQLRPCPAIGIIPVDGGALSGLRGAHDGSSIALLPGAFPGDARRAAGGLLRVGEVRALLAYLAVEADRPHPREMLAGLFWPDWPEPFALANLRYALANLRESIGDRPGTPAPPPFPARLPRGDAVQRRERP